MSVYKQKGRKTFMMDFTFKRHRVIKSTGETNKKRAEKYAEDYRNALKDGARGLWSKERPYLLGAAAKEWRTKSRKNPWSPSMQAIVDSGLRRLIKDYENEDPEKLDKKEKKKKMEGYFDKNRLLADIEAEDIAKYQRDRLAEKPRPSNRTVNMEIGTLRKVLIHAGHWPRLRDSVHMLPEREDVGQALTPEQERPLLEECGRSVSHALLPFVTLAIDTGARYDTIRTLQWERVDLQRGTIKIGKDKTAAGTGRTVPLNARALQTLKFWADQFPKRKPEHYVFPAVRYGLHGEEGTFGGVVQAYETDPSRPVGTIQSAWEGAKRRTQLHCPACAEGRLTERKPAKRKRGVAVEPTAAGYLCKGCGHTTDKLPDGAAGFRFHDLRHTAVSRMIVAGLPLPIIAKVVGWRLSTVVQMAERYGHFQEDDMRRAVEVISALPVPRESTCGLDASGVVVQ